MDWGLWIATCLLLVLSFIKSKQKTKQALLLALKKFTTILPLFLVIMAIFAITITFIPNETIKEIVGSESGINGVLISLGLGSVSVMPGFVAYPLGGILYQNHIPYYIIAAFVVSLMNVGIVSFPLEKKFLGLKVALLRNLLAVVLTLLVVIIIKLLFNE